MDFEEIHSMRKRRVQLTHAVPMSLIELIDRIADAEQRKSSEVVERLLRKGLLVERAERERAQKVS